MFVHLVGSYIPTVIWNICRSHKNECLASYTKVMSSNAVRYPLKMRTFLCRLTRSLKFRQLVMELLSIIFCETPFSLSWVLTYIFMKGQIILRRSMSLPAEKARHPVPTGCLSSVPTVLIGKIISNCSSVGWLYRKWTLLRQHLYNYNESCTCSICVY